MTATKTAPMPFKEGQAVRTYKTSVRSERQRHYHEAAELPAHLFGDHVDLSVLAIDTIEAVRYLQPDNGKSLHAGQRMIQNTPVYLGEELLLDGCVAEIRPAARGAFVIFAFDFVRADGSIPLKGELTMLRLAQTATRGEDAAAGDGDILDRAGLVRVSGKRLSQEIVADYSFEFSDREDYFNPATAASAGLRAPYAPNAIAFTWMMEAIARDGMPQALDLSATFRRPLHWEDAVQLFWRGRRDLLLAKNDGLICATGRVASIERA